MKKRISLILVIAMLFGMAVSAMPVSAADGDGFYVVPVPSMSDNNTLVFDVMYNDTNNCGVSYFGLLLDYSDNISLTDIEYIYTVGTFMNSESIEEKPQHIIHVIGTGVFPMNEETLMYRLTFDVIGSISSGVSLDLSYDENNIPSDINGVEIPEWKLPVMAEQNYSKNEIVDSDVPDVPDMPEDPEEPVIPPEIDGEGFYLVPKYANQNRIMFDLRMKAKYPVTQYGLLVDYDSNLYLTSCTNANSFGTYASSPSTDSKPYMILWVSGIKDYEAGVEYTVARLEFSINDINKGVTVDLSYEPNNMPAGSNGNEYTESQIPIKGVSYSRIQLAQMFPDVHSWRYYPDRAATCTQPGWKEYSVCSNCGEITYEEIPAKGHSICGVDGKKPTCGEDGWYPYDICLDCDYSTFKVAPATGEHKGGTTTCTKQAICDVCHGEYGHIDDTNHGETEINGYIEPTKYAEGYSGDTYCKDCGAMTEKGTVLPRQNMPGDATGDDKVNISDVSLILKHIAKWGVYMDMAAADVNDDGKVNISDVSLILKYVAKWDVTLK